MNANEERRKSPRVEGSVNVDLVSRGRMPGDVLWEVMGSAVVRDVSREGLRIMTHQNLHLSSEIGVIAYFIGRNAVCVCRIIWKKFGGHGFVYGLEIKGRLPLDATAPGSFTRMPRPRFDMAA